MNYSQEKINQILLSKQLNEFYLAIIEHKGDLLTDEEYETIIRRDDNIYNSASKEDIDDLVDKFKTNEKLKGFIPELMKMVYSLSQIRHIALLTMIDGEIYDIANVEFVDLQRNKIVHYDNFAKYYDKNNSRIKCFTPEEVPLLQQKTVLVDVDDESIIQTYEKEHINQAESEDLTSNFYAEVNGKSYRLSRKSSNKTV